ncbi:MAG: RelA/SpoT family protein [Gammaproteobacteria bacterium]
MPRTTDHSDDLEAVGTGPGSDVVDALVKATRSWPEKDRETLDKVISLDVDIAPAKTPCWVSVQAAPVALILIELRADPETVLAAMLAAACTAGLIDSAGVRSRFSPTLAAMVEEGERLSAFGGYRTRMQADPGAETETLRRMLLAMVKDARVVMIKLAERVQLMRDLKHLPESERAAIAEETRDLYAPLANRLGVGQLKWELEDLSFRFLEPATYKQIARSLDERRVDREAYIRQVTGQLRKALDEAGIKGQVAGRPKHIFSIWKKMQRKGVNFESLFDVRAVRILVDDVAGCYAALGLVHTLWQPIPKEFDDYIANPKANLYQSLHTAVIGPEGKTLEVQIRSFEMHEHSEHGVAAHWRYKEGGTRHPGLDRKINWLRTLLSDDPAEGEAEDVVERIRAEAFEDRIYVFSPQGRVVDLPAGATPLDFAYAIHTEVGNRCRGAKVDGRIVPLTYSLQTGQQVEILTAREGGPSRDWLDAREGYLRTSGARAKVRAWFNKLDAGRHGNDGRALVDRELKRLDLSGLDMQAFAARFKYEQLDDFYAAVGRGLVSQAQIAAALQSELLPAAESSEPAQRLPRRKAGRGGVLSKGEEISVRGVGSLLTQFAKCCTPVPYDEIIGFITRGRGVTIHRVDCPNVMNMPDEERARFIEVSWEGGDTEEKPVYAVDLVIEAVDRQGLLRDVTGTLANEMVNVTAVNTASDKAEHSARMAITVEVHDSVQLSRVLDKLNQLPNVLEARRTR